MVLPDTVLFAGSMYIEMYGDVLALKTRTPIGTLILRALVLLLALLKSIYGVWSGSNRLRPGTINIFFAMQRFFRYSINTQYMVYIKNIFVFTIKFIIITETINIKDQN